jgi:hypothetical protein
MKTLFTIWILASCYAQAQCSNATLHGDYGFTVSGTRPTGPGGPLEQFIGLAMTRFDGNGHLTQTGASHGSINGDSIDDSVTGTYTLNSDCTGTMILQFPGGRPTVRTWIVVVDRGEEVRTVVMTPVTPAGPVAASNLTTSNGRKVWLTGN